MSNIMTKMSDDLNHRMDSIANDIEKKTGKLNKKIVDKRVNSESSN